MKLLFSTDARAEIRTNAETPIWSKQCAYLMSVNTFLNEAVQRLLNDVLIRPSKSPYNLPIWVVPKKGTNRDRSQKSLTTKN